ELVVLQVTAPAVVTHQNVQLAVWPKTQHAAVVIPARLLVCVRLKSVQLDQIAIEGERRAVPDVAIDSIAEQRHIRKICRIDTRVALRPIKIDVSVESKIRVQSDSQTAPLRSAVHGEIERRRALNHTVRDSLNFARVLLEDKKLVVADEGHARRLRQSSDHSLDGKIRIGHGWTVRGRAYVCL